MSKLFIADPLQKLLQYWEDTNLSGEFSFLLNQIIKSWPNYPPNPKKTNTMIGSELNGMGLLSRSIPEYKNLRKILEGHSLIHPTNFLPRIPKDFRGIFGDNRELFIDHQFVQTPIHVPMYLLKWNETKRACIIDDSIPIPCIDLRNENWLEKIPYHSFFLQIKSPFIFLDPENREWTIKDMIIYDDGEYLRMLTWPEEIGKFTLTSESRKELAEALSLLRKGKSPKPKIVNNAFMINDWFMIPLVIQKSTGLLKNVKMYGEIDHINIYDDDLLEEDDGQSAPLYLKMKVLLETVNGFCKLMTTLPPRQPVIVIDSNTQSQHPDIPRQWFELPLQTVEYFHTEKKEELVIIRHGTGSEKSPHIRRGHTRRYVKKDGIVYETWIEEVTVRADKLLTEQLQGGALKIE